MTMKPKEQEIAAGAFKAKCLALLEDVHDRRVTFIVTKRGRPVARVVPLVRPTAGTLEGSLLHEEDLVEPTGAAWDADTSRGGRTRRTKAR